MEFFIGHDGKCSIRHTRVKARDLVPHELNFRTHPDAQRAALATLYDEIGFAHSFLAYELPDGRLKLMTATCAGS
jgi:hypothetical protein